MGTPGSYCGDSDLSEMKLRDLSYIQGKSRICRVIRDKINATGELVKTFPPHVQVVGLYGRGGIGKTTFCRAICNEMWTEFSGKVFHFELGGENERQSPVQTLLGKLMGTRNEVYIDQNLNNYAFDHKMSKEARKHRIFLAIDNVMGSAEVIAQADALLANCYAKGSVVLVTARSFDDLEKLNFNIRDESHCIEMPELDESEAKSLLLYHAAPSSNDHVNEDILRQCLQRCCFRKGGLNGDDGDCTDYFLPQALEMLGQQLGSDVDQWMAKLEELDHTLNSSTLKKSFDALSIEDQTLFMDAALFYPRNHYDGDHHLVNQSRRVWGRISTLDWLHMIHGGSVEDIKRRLKGLKEKSLLQSFDESFDESSHADVVVHVSRREVAAAEANLEASTSVWFYENDEDARSLSRESHSLRGGGDWGINLERAFIWKKGRKLQGELTSFSCCANLTVLTLRNVPGMHKQLDLSPLKCLKSLEVHSPARKVLGLGSLGSHLLVLRWFHMLATSPCLQEIGLLTNLHILQLYLVPWKSTEVSKIYIHQIDFSRLNLLQTVSLYATEQLWYRNLNSFSRDVRILKYDIEPWVRQEKLNIGGDHRHDQDGTVDIKFSSLLNFRKLENLQKLDISGSACKAIPLALGELVTLRELNASRCPSLEVVPDLRKLQRLQRLDVSYCVSLTALPGLEELVDLLALDACGCCNLRELPNLQKLQRLETLDIAVCLSIKAVPGLGELVALVTLRAGGCSHLESLPSLEKLQNLQRLDISYSPQIKAVPGLGALVALRELRAENCSNLAELPDVRNLTSLRVLNLKISSYYYDKWETHPEERPTYYIKSLSGIGELVAMTKLAIDFAAFEDAPDDLHKLTNLTKLSLRGWSSRAALGVSTLPNLQALTISYVEGLQLVEPTGVSRLRSLRRLKLYRCDFEDVSCLGDSPALQHLHVKCHDSNYTKKLLLSLLELPRLGFTVCVQLGDGREWESVQDELERLDARTSSLIA